MQNVTVFLPEASVKRLSVALRQAFTTDSINFSPDESNWLKASISRKAGWFSTHKLTINVRSAGRAAEFAPMMNNMAAFVQQMSIHNPVVVQHLLKRMAASQTALGVTGEKVALFETELFRLASSFDGFLFVDGKAFVNSDGMLLLSLDGRSELPIVESVNVSTNEDSKAVLSTQLTRKQKSIALLEQRGIPYISHLPVVDTDETVQLRSKEEVAQRALAIAFSAVKAEGLEDEIIQLLIRQYKAAPFFSFEEQAFIDSNPASESDRVKFSWRYECLNVLLWVLGYVDELTFPSAICDVSLSAAIIREAESYENFVANARMRTASDVLDALDLIYRLNWACVNARVKRQAPPEGVEPGVVHERHYVLNWLTHYMDQDWDSISTDT